MRLCPILAPLTPKGLSNHRSISQVRQVETVATVTEYQLKVQIVSPSHGNTRMDLGFRPVRPTKPFDQGRCHLLNEGLTQPIICQPLSGVVPPPKPGPFKWA